LGYTLRCAVVVVEARPFLFATEYTAMIILGIIMLIIVLGAMCWLLFNLAVFALPLFAAVSVGLATTDTGAGPIGAIFLGLLAGIATLTAGQMVFTLVPSTLVRVAVAGLFAIPAAIAGYHATHGLAALAIPAEGWRQAFAVFGAGAISLTALARLALPRGAGFRATPSDARLSGQ
tara:strand:+ start:67039 stop:67566 length:528 start_codon:yes stop_codon:yes gene_type:complete